MGFVSPILIEGRHNATYHIMYTPSKSLSCSPIILHKLSHFTAMEGQWPREDPISPTYKKGSFVMPLTLSVLIFNKITYQRYGMFQT